MSLACRYPSTVCLVLVSTVLAAPWPAAPAWPQQPAPPVLDETLCRELQTIVDDVVDRYQLPGMLAAVMKDRKIVAQVASGVRNVRHPDVPLTIHDTGHLGSCSKALTATLAGILVDNGMLDWQDTVADRLPRLADEIDPVYRDVTLWQLLTHTAGVAANGPAWSGGGVATPENRQRIVAKGLKTKPSELMVGKYAYSNLGYLVAAAMMESATAQTWEQLVTEKLFEPLEMTSAGFGPPATGDQIDQPWGHFLRGKVPVPTSRDNPPAMGPAGTIHANLADWARFVSLHMAAGNDEASLIHDQTRRFLHTPPETSGANRYSGGWIVVKLASGGYELQHEGSNTFWLASVVLQPESGSAILLITNHALQPALPANHEAIRRIRRLVQ